MSDTCQRCGTSLNLPTSPPTVHLSHQGETIEIICMTCYTKETAEMLGIDLQPLPFDIISMMDSTGQMHQFKVFCQVVPRYIILKASEITDADIAGYEFAVHGSHKVDISTICEKLVKKMERELCTQYIRDDTFDGYTMKDIAGDVVRGRIECNLDYPSDEPLVIVDGQPYPWSDLGRMLLKFEGFHFKLKMSSFTED